MRRSFEQFTLPSPKKLKFVDEERERVKERPPKLKEKKKKKHKKNSKSLTGMKTSVFWIIIKSSIFWKLNI